MSVKTLMTTPEIITNTAFPDPGAIHRLPDDEEEIAWNRAFDVIFEQKKDKIFDRAHAKWWAAYYDIIFDRAFESCPNDCKSEEEFQSHLDKAMDREIEAEMDCSFGAFYDLAAKQTITRKMINREIKRIKKSA